MSSKNTVGLLESLLPPRPTAEPDGAVVERVALYLRKSAVDGLDFNAHLRSLKSFRNPSILEKLVNKFDIDEHGSCCEPSVWNPHQFDKSDRYDVLAKRARQTEVERSSATTGRVEFVAASTTSADAAAAAKKPPLSEHAKKLVKKEKFRQKAIKQRENAAAAQARAVDNQKKRTWF